jgi:hypothetical protein
MSARDLAEVGAESHNNPVCGCFSRKRITRFAEDVHMSNDSK